MARKRAPGLSRTLGPKSEDCASKTSRACAPHRVHIYFNSDRNLLGPSGRPRIRRAVLPGETFLRRPRTGPQIISLGVEREVISTLDNSYSLLRAVRLRVKQEQIAGNATAISD